MHIFIDGILGGNILIIGRKNSQHGVVRAAGPSVRTEETRRREQQQIAAYRELVELVNMKVRDSHIIYITCLILVRRSHMGNT